MLGIISAASQVAALFGLFDKVAAITGSVLAGKRGKPARAEKINSGARSSTTLIAGRALTLAGLFGPVWYALGQILPEIHDAAATGAFTATDIIMIASGFVMAVMRYKTTDPVVGN